jgi:hypothetical protein
VAAPVKRIPLRARDGRVRAYAVVDDADFPWLGQWGWLLTKDGRAARTEHRRVVFMHRQIAGRLVDHRDRDPLNNRRWNLRPCTNAENNQNKGVSKANRSGFRGVSRRRSQDRGRCWRAVAQLDGRQHHVGYYRTPEEADRAIKAWRIEHMPFSVEVTT